MPRPTPSEWHEILRSLPNPDHIRAVTKATPVGPVSETIEFWLPREIEGLSWTCFFKLSWMDRAYPNNVGGVDPLAAIINALYMIRSLIDANGGILEFHQSHKGGFPLWPNAALGQDRTGQIESLIAEIELADLNIRRPV